MIRFPVLRIALAGSALAFTGCLGGTGTSTEHQPTGLYRCIGETGVYYVNIASVRLDGSPDTNYAKVGMVGNPCVR